MCLAIPGEILEIFEENGIKMGKINYAGTQNTVCLEYVEEAEVGKYVLVHAGFALSVLDEGDAQCSLDLWGEMIEKAEQNEDYTIDWDNKRIDTNSKPSEK